MASASTADSFLVSHGAILNNEHINSMASRNERFLEHMRQIEGTYKVRQDHRAEEGYKFRIRLIWDYDRLWGTFELRGINGILLIDPGPGQDHFQAIDKHDHQHQGNPEPKDGHQRPDPCSQQYIMRWRDATTKMPGIVFNFSFAIGTIRFGDREICGYFIGMPGVGLPRGRFDFHGRKPFGTADVPPFWSIQDFVEEWNHYNIWYKSHVPRSGIAKADKPRDDEDCKYLTLFAKLDAKDRSWRKDFLLSITGYFCITDVSIGIKGQRHVRERTIRVHVGDDDTRIWGHFDFGEVEGYICTSPILKEDGNVLEDAIEFKWHGRESETGKSLRRSLSGKGTVAFLTNMTILGTFCKMVGDHDIHFNGKRKFMPEGSSGLNMAYYRKGWDDYSHGNSVDVSYS